MMVSLSSDRTHSAGYFGFSDDCALINPANSDDELIVDHIEMVSGPQAVHTPINTTWALLLSKMMYVGLGVASYVIPQECGDNRCGDDSQALTMYVHGGMWFAVSAMDRYFHHAHSKIRRSGYLAFDKKTKKLRRMPQVISSMSNSLMVVLLKLLDNHCDPSGTCKLLSKTRHVQILITIEVVVTLGALIVLLIHTLRFNCKQALPDAIQAELTTNFDMPSNLATRSYQEYHQQIMDRQSDIIRFLQQQTEDLSKRNLALTDEVNKQKTLKQDDAVPS